MRVICSLSLVFLACGGRTIGDPVFDEGANGGSLATGGRSGTGGAPGKGGAPSTGGTSLGGSFGLGGQPTTGGRPSTGGRPNTGGVIGSGGKLSTGGVIGSGGFIATGGTGTGGAPTIDKSCVQVCDKIQDLCGVLPGQTAQQCAAGCSQPLVSSSPACQMASRELLDCINKTLSVAQAGCSAIGGLVLLACSNQLVKANGCTTVLPPEMCVESVQVMGNQCERVRSCGTSNYRTTCSGSDTFMTCRCQVDGVVRTKMGYSGTFDACERALAFPCP